MKHWIPTKRTLFLWFSILMVFSLVYSRFMISVCLFAWLIMAFFTWSYEKNRPVLSDAVSSFARRLSQPSNRALLLLSGFFFIPLLLGIHSADQGEWMERLRIKLPYLGMAVAFILLPSPDKNTWRILLVAVNIALISSVFYVLYQYVIHFETINDQLAQGIPMPTPVNHTRYSLLIALIILFNTAALYKNSRNTGAFIQGLGIGATLFLILFLHILSVRSGLAVFYIGAVWLILSYAWLRKSFFLAAIMLTGIVLLPLLAYYTSPSLKKRVDYMRYDLKQFLKGEGRQYSDSERIYSLQAGWKVFKRHPWTGVGTGDLRLAMRETYRAMNLREDKLPHNQFVTVLASNGVIGLLLFLYCLFKPFFSKMRRESIYFSTFLLVLFLSFMVENTIENSVGVAFHIVFLSLLLLRERSLSDDAFPDEVM